jgi:hypothetical protein
LTTQWDGITPVVSVEVRFADGAVVPWNADAAEKVLARDKAGDSPVVLIVQRLTLRVRISPGLR